MVRRALTTTVDLIINCFPLRSGHVNTGGASDLDMFDVIKIDNGFFSYDNFGFQGGIVVLMMSTLPSRMKHEIKMVCLNEFKTACERDGILI